MRTAREDDHRRAPELSRGARAADDVEMSVAIHRLADVATAAAPEAVEQALDAARALLGLEVAYLARLTDEQQTIAAASGDAEALRCPVGSSVAREDSLCHRMLAGEIPHLVADVSADARAAEVPFARDAGIQTYLGVPVQLSDGTVYGSLCGVSRETQDALTERDVAMMKVLARMTASQVERELTARRTQRLEHETQAGQALLAALDARERYTASHSQAVVELAVAVGDALGLDEAAVAQVGQVALLHDIGKLGIPDAILQKPGSLTRAEWKVMREHPVIGARLVASVDALAHLAPAVRAEHERWDGGGYPDGLAGAAIPIVSRICLACDAYHAMTSDRPYRAAMTVQAARDELARNAGSQFCPRTVEALLAVLDERPALATGSTEEAAALPLAPAREAAELRALVNVAAAVAGAYRFEDVLETAAEEINDALQAHSTSISRWDRADGIVTTLVNVGELSPAEVRFPADETYALAGLPSVVALLERGEPYACALDGDDPPIVAILERLGKGSTVAVPIVLEDETWGQVDVFTGPGELPFTRADAPFLVAVADQVAVAIGRSQQFARTRALAYEDPLTKLANRRALEERLEAAVEAAHAATAPLAVLFCDLDGLKAVNDEHGHAAGDRALCAAATALADSAAGGLVGRMGGDEFCVLLEGVDAQAAEAVARAAGQRLARATGSDCLSFSCGIALLKPGDRPAALLRRADAAQYAAKRAGGGRVYVAEPDAAGPGRARRGERKPRRGDLWRQVLARLDDELAGASVPERLEAVAHDYARALRAQSWWLCTGEVGEPLIHTLATGGPDPGQRYRAPGEAFVLADFPAVADALACDGTYLVRRDVEAQRYAWEDVAEGGASAALGVTVREGKVRYLVEILGDEGTRPLGGALEEIRLLAREAVAGVRGA